MMRRPLIVAAMAAMVFVGCGGDDNPTAPAPGSCCLTNGTCTVTTETNCAGTWAAGGVCEPNSCVRPTGSCCALDGTCTVTKQAVCTRASTWTMFGVCDPNSCVQPPDSNYLPQASPANVLANLQMAYGERRIDEYRKLFAEDFLFVFSPSDTIRPDNPTPAHWPLADELEATDNMFRSALVERVELTSYVLGVPEPADSVTWGPRAWSVRVDAANVLIATRNETGEPLTYIVDGATERFFFREDPTRPASDGRPTWYIFRWEDQPIGGRKTETTSWGQVKNLFR